MHFAIAFIALWLLAAASQASAQPYPGVGVGPKLGELEVKAYQKIPKTKVAVQLTADNHLSRELRRQVMIRLSQRAGEAIINRMFDNADKNTVGDAGCPL